MARTDNPALTSVRQFLSAVCGHAVPHIRSADEFCAAFPPELIMDRVEDIEVRANILYATAGTRIEVARRTSKRSAGEQLKIALAEKLVAPEVVIELLSPDHRAQYLDGPDLWAFVVEKRFWETFDGPSEAKVAKGMLALILESALNIELVSPEEIVRAIGFPTFFEKESNQRLVDSFEAFTNAEPGKGFDFLLGRYTPVVMVESIALDVIWNHVIHPLIAVRNGLALEEEQHIRADELAEASSHQPLSTPAQVNASATAPSSSPASSPSAPPSASTENLLKREATSPVTGSITRPSIPVGPHASSIPAASRLSSGSQSSQGQESDYRDPKGDEASDLEDADAEDMVDADAEDMVVEEDDLILASVTSDPAETNDAMQHWTDDGAVPQNSASVVSSASDATGEHDENAVERDDQPPKDSEPSSPDISVQVAKSFAPQRTASSTPPAVSPPILQVPRPRSDKRLHPTGDANVEMAVELASLSDPDVRAALRDEPTLDHVSIPSTRGRSSTGAFVPDSEPSRAGGAIRSAPPASSRISMTPMSSKTAVCDLLRSADGGLKLTNIDPSTCGIRNLMIAALEEIDPSSYSGAQQRYGAADRLDLGNILCSEVDKRSTRISARLRQILGEIGCATKTGSSPSNSSARPPPLPYSKAPQSNPGSSEQRVIRVPQVEKKE